MNHQSELASSVSPSSSIKAPSNDSANTANVQTPEKFAALTLNGKPMDSPLRRSNRLSMFTDAAKELPASEEQDDLEADGGSNDESLGREDELTMERAESVERMQLPEDEPSSALASRIIRAHDNPSPPPDAVSISAGRRRNRSITEDSKTIVQYDVDEATEALTPLVLSVSRSPSPIYKDSTSQPNALPLDLLTSNFLPIENPFVDTVIRRDGQQSGASEISTNTNWSASSIAALTPRSPSPQQIESQDQDPPTIDNVKPSILPIRTPDVDSTEEFQSNSPEPLTTILVEPPLLLRSSSPSPKASTSKAGFLQGESPTRALRRSPRRSVAPRFQPTDRTLVAPPLPQLSPSNAVDNNDESKGEHEKMGGIADTLGSFLQPPASNSEEAENSGGKVKATQDPSPDGTPMRKMSRELGSLSPDSSQVLSQLRFGSGSSFLPQTLDGETKPPDRVGRHLEDWLIPAPVFPHLSQGPQRVPMTPERLGSPKRGSNRPKFQFASLRPDVEQTPARRVPIREAVSQGYVSPQKAARLNAARGSGMSNTSRAPILNIPPTDSPARRITPTTSHTARQKPRSETNPMANRTDQQSCVAGQPSATAINSQSLNNATYTPKSLPFPLVSASIDVSRSASIAGKGKDPPSTAQITSDETSRSFTALSPNKSSLKQTSSRIPRPVTKPYARPPSRTLPASDTVTVIRKADPHRVKTDISSPMKGIASKVSTGHNPLISQAGEPSSSTLVSRRGFGISTSSPLKRKRVVQEPPKLQPVVIIDDKPSSREESPSQQRTTAQRSQQPDPPKFRLVVDTPPQENLSSMITSPEAEFAESQLPHGRIEGDSVPPPVGSFKEVQSLQSTSPPLQPTSPKGPLPVVDDGTDVSLGGLQQNPNGRVRRTTRTRKPVQYFPEVVSQPEPRAPQSRRKAPAGQTDSEGFAGMSAVALKTLTSNNTARNQVYLTVNLETEVIRKEGTRPESPAVKVKTIAERQQEERDQLRRERAQRRAKRSEAACTGIVSDTDLEGVDNYPPSSPTLGQRHTPGDAGSDEESDDSCRHIKRTKGDDGRHVKWRKSLIKTINLDDIKPGTRARPQENMIKKGCLAPKAKAVRLDTLGNLPNADSPLKDLVQENISVKKFVYDDDVEPIVEIVVKNTRSRAKKGKS